MSMTCKESESEAMISPMASAICPETPVSISSKIIVGRLFSLASNALSDSITRDISPPDAIFAMGWGVNALLDVKRYSTSLHPQLLRDSKCLTSIEINASGIPNFASVVHISFANFTAAFWRRCSIFTATSLALFSASAICDFRRERSSSLWVIVESLAV